jgi:predicted metalloprotease
MFFGGENGQMVGNILANKREAKRSTEQRDLTTKLEEQDFINAILVDNEDVWTRNFKKII